MRQGMAWQGWARHGKARRGVAGHGKARQNINGEAKKILPDDLEKTAELWFHSAEDRRFVETQIRNLRLPGGFDASTRIIWLGERDLPRVSGLPFPEHEVELLDELWEDHECRVMSRK